MEKRERTLVFILIFILLAGYGAYLVYGTGIVQGAIAGSTSEAEASTPFGESLAITLGSSSQTSGTASFWDKSQLAAWLAYSDSDSQIVYEVNSTYKSQELVELGYTLSVTYSQVSNIEATVKIKAIDDADDSEYEYTLANAKSLSGASPINDNGNTQPSITTHLGHVVASTTDATIYYQIYAQVTATGTVSGETLTATIPYTKFGALHFEQSSESSEANVTPTLTVTSWYDQQLGLPDGALLNFISIVCLITAVVFAYRRMNQ